MSDSPIPDDVRQFLAQHVQSIAQLEVLLLISGAADRSWRANEVYKVVLSNEDSIAKILENFTKIGLARKLETAAFQFSPASEQIQILVKNLAALYRERPGRVIQAIYEARVSEIQEFAKAFKIRKET